jgi:hypothetical protein
MRMHAKQTGDHPHSPALGLGRRGGRPGPMSQGGPKKIPIICYHACVLSMRGKEGALHVAAALRLEGSGTLRGCDPPA